MSGKIYRSKLSPPGRLVRALSLHRRSHRAWSASVSPAMNTTLPRQEPLMQDADAAMRPPTMELGASRVVDVASPDPVGDVHVWKKITDDDSQRLLTSTSLLSSIGAGDVSSSAKAEEDDVVSDEQPQADAEYEHLDDFCLRLVKKIPENMYVHIVRRRIKLEQMLNRTRVRVRSSNAYDKLRMSFATDCKKVLGKLAADFGEGFDRYKELITVDKLEQARGDFERDELFRACVVVGENGPIHEGFRPKTLAYIAMGRHTVVVQRSTDVAMARTLLTPLQNTRRKIFIDNLPVDVDETKLLKCFRHFGNIVGLEIFKERAPKRALHLANELASIETDAELASIEANEVENHELASIEGADVESSLDEAHEAFSDAGSLAAEADNAGVLEEEESTTMLKSKKKAKKPITKPKPVPDSNIYAAMYFETEAEAASALDPSVQLFGVVLPDTMTSTASTRLKKRPFYRSCRTSEPSASLFVGNLPFNLHGHNVEEELYDLISSHSIEFTAGIKNCLQTDRFNLGKGSVIVQFESHAIAWDAFNALYSSRLRGRPLRVGWVSNTLLNSIYSNQRRRQRMKEFVSWH